MRRHEQHSLRNATNILKLGGRRDVGAARSPPLRTRTAAAGDGGRAGLAHVSMGGGTYLESV